MSRESDDLKEIKTSGIEERGEFLSIFLRGWQYRRERKDKESHWFKRTANGFMPARRSRGRRLERLCDQWKKLPRVQRFPRLRARPIRHFLDIPPTSSLSNPQTSWLVEGLIPQSELILITGVPGSFKSFLSQALASAVSQGNDFLGRRTTKSVVLILDRDNPQHVVAQRRDC